jgi:hypothetical protein
MGRQMVEQGRVKSHLRVLRFYSKVILGPSFLFVLVNARLQFYPAPNSGTVSFITCVEAEPAVGAIRRIGMICNAL